ncbi:hypothetical protein GALMADRAFT_926826 [Galerina marginata CBS 339.88]|uniref:Uncharacterized protein n=1 Tax=Galerina marginata (strain CBS 339.88) TaxID=685588 RepID=A0A067SNI6_GALM3|nr:hypothetical protein GALMADRAFT_926826 [Galerina marginata CBS 339.88]
MVIMPPVPTQLTVPYLQIACTIIMPLPLNTKLSACLLVKSRFRPSAARAHQG